MIDTVRVENDGYTQLTADIVSAYVSNNSVRPVDLPDLIVQIHAIIAGLAMPAVGADRKTAKTTPAQIRKSITPDALISFLDGKPYKTLKRHLAKHGLDIAGYRARYGLPADYPTVAPSYSATRAALAERFGLGRQRRGSVQATP